LDRTKKLLLEKIKKLTFNTQKIEPFEDVLKYINNWEDCSLEVKKSVCSYFINKIYITDDKIEMDWKL
jgi:hypothetical protein